MAIASRAARSVKWSAYLEERGTAMTLRIPLALIAGAALIAGCAGAPAIGRHADRPDERSRPSDAAAVLAVEHAQRLLGMPYRFGGANPRSGFDCSGLVQYSFSRAGVQVPRSTQTQRGASRAVRLSDLRRGDLLFFDQEGKKSSHVGIYVGNGEFVHAASSGRRVRRDRLDAQYWLRHFSEARRFPI